MLGLLNNSQLSFAIELAQAQKITLGQIDNGTLATAVNCAETIAVMRHGRVEAYLLPKHVIDALTRDAAKELAKGITDTVQKGESSC